MAIEFRGGNISIGSTALYPFTSFRFTTAGVSGSLGPSGSILLAAYTGSSSGSYFSNPQYFTTGSYQGYQIWTVPETATYEIEIAGAASGLTNYPTPAGRYSSGAIIKGRVPLTQEQKFVMVVGQRSLNATTSATAYNGIGGAGGSFFVLSGSNTPYLVAGGGGGFGAYSGDPLGGGILRSGSLSGNGSTSTSGSTSFRGAPGGTGSLGGRSHINTASVVSSNLYDGGGGAGFSGNGFAGTGLIATTYINAQGSHGQGGISFLSGSQGGGAATSYTPNNATVGGFGGGGGGTPIAGGGGGGYAGGAGSYGTTQPVADGGGGGSSYIISTATSISTSDGNYGGLTTFSGSAITNLNSYNSGSGYIRITKL